MYVYGMPQARVHRFQCSSASRKFLNPHPAPVVKREIHVSVLFSEPKIPQFDRLMLKRQRCRLVSVLFSEPKIPQSMRSAPPSPRSAVVSVLFSEPKIPQSSIRTILTLMSYSVSVLFSEPKIPQLWEIDDLLLVRDVFQCSSASRKFLNVRRAARMRLVRQVSVLFSEPKIPQYCPIAALEVKRRCFSALQRAENSSIGRPARPRPDARRVFQCSSASRKFLNVQRARAVPQAPVFQCSSASRKFLNRRSVVLRLRRARVSVLFSEPKIPQYRRAVA